MNQRQMCVSSTLWIWINTDALLLSRILFVYTVHILVVIYHRILFIHVIHVYKIYISYRFYCIRPDVVCDVTAHAHICDLYLLP